MLCAPESGVIRASSVAVVGTHHVPERALERREKDQPPVRRHRHPVATLIVFLFPEQLLGDQVQTHELLGRADVDPLGRGTGADALDVERLPLGVEPGGRDALDELVAVVDVEDQEAVAAVLEIVANPGLGDVEQPPHFGGLARGFHLAVRAL